MLRHEMVTEAQALIEDPDYWTAARLTVLFNRGMRDLSNKMGVVTTGYFRFLSEADKQQYQLPYDFKYWELLNFTIEGTTNIIHLKPRPRNIYGIVSDPTESGTPTRAFIWAKEDREELWIYPTFDTDGYDCDLFYWRRPPDIVLDNDEPLIPRDWHTYLVDYAVNYTLQQDQERGWSFAMFTNWWEGTKQNIQVTRTVGEAAHDDIRIGNFDDNLPRVAGEHSEGYFRISESGVQW